MMTATLLVARAAATRTGEMDLAAHGRAMQGLAKIFRPFGRRG